MYKTTAGSIGGSVTTVIPSGLSKMLGIEKGDKIRWVADVTEKGVTITVIPEKKEEL